MINTSNYLEQTKGMNFSQMPEHLQKGHAYVLKATENGSNWNAYNNDNIKRVMDSYFTKLETFLSQSPVKVKKEKHEASDHTEKETSPDVKHTVKKHAKHHAPVSHEEYENDFSFVERIPEEIRFLRRYLSLNEKKKTKDDLLRFINAIHRAIIEKRIRKTSPYAKQMEYIQDKLVKTYNSMGNSITAQISDKVFAEFKALIGSEKVMPSVQLIKRYISLNGKYGVKEKAKLLIDAMTRAYNKNKITKSDKYFKVFDQMHFNLSQYVKNKSQKILNIQPTELNGLNGFLSGCGCELDCLHDEPELNGVSETESQAQNTGVVSSMDFKNVQFKTLGFVGKYRKLIGDPSRGFSAMVFGRPKMGKSFLCVDFAGYLARNHGKVLYIAREEGLDITLQEKLKAKDVAHPNLFISEEIPSDLSPYDFIFFDSVNKLGLSVDDLGTLRQNYPDKSFIYVFQTTKDGHFRGANEFQHDVDVVIEVPEKGLAVQNGRFNQGGEMRIFEDTEYKQAA